MGDLASFESLLVPRSTRTAARHGAYELEHLRGALTKLVPISLGGT